MTSASELFQSRRSRCRATPDSLLDTLHTDRNYDFHRRLHRSNNGCVSKGCDSLRQTSASVRHGCLRSSHPLVQDGRTTQLDQIISLSRSSTVVGNLIDSGKNGLNENNRLPEAVLIARARIFERLRGGNSDSTAGSINRRREISVGQSLESSLRLTSQTEHVQISEDPSMNTPCVSQVARFHLPIKIYSQKETRTSWDCSICLDSFSDGDKLVCLPCKHHFHSACLDPWVRARRDCPCCRRSIIVEG